MTTWDLPNKSATADSSFFLLIDDDFTLLIDDDGHELLIEETQGTDWTNIQKSS